MAEATAEPYTSAHDVQVDWERTWAVYQQVLNSSTVRRIRALEPGARGDRDDVRTLLTAYDQVRPDQWADRESTLATTAAAAHATRVLLTRLESENYRAPALREQLGTLAEASARLAGRMEATDPQRWRDLMAGQGNGPQQDSEVSQPQQPQQPKENKVSVEKSAPAASAPARSERPVIADEFKSVAGARAAVIDAGVDPKTVASLFDGIAAHLTDIQKELAEIRETLEAPVVAPAGQERETTAEAFKKAFQVARENAKDHPVWQRISALMDRPRQMWEDTKRILGRAYEKVTKDPRWNAFRQEVTAKVCDGVSRLSHGAARQLEKAAEMPGRIEQAGQAMSARIDRAGQAFAERIEQAGQVVAERIEQAGQAFADGIDRAGQAVVGKVEQAGQAVAGKVNSGMINALNGLAEAASKHSARLQDRGQKSSQSAGRSAGPTRQGPGSPESRPPKAARAAAGVGL